MPDLPTLITAVYGTLIIGGGYAIVWFRHRLKNKMKTFYDMNAYDKAIQSLIFGTILVISTSKATLLSLNTFEQFDKFLEIAPQFVLMEIILIFYLSVLLNFIEQVANKRRVFMRM